MLRQAQETGFAGVGAPAAVADVARDGSTVDVRATRVGYRRRNIGENIADGQRTADAVVQGWLGSPDHFANIMAPAYEEMGTAFVVNTRSTMGIYWVQVFGAGR